MTQPKPPDETPDSPTVDLSRQAAGGDQDAFGGLYQRHFDRILRAVALRHGKLLRDCEHEIEDAVHEAFTDAFRRIAAETVPGIHSAGAFRAYVAKAAENRIRDRARGARAQKRGEGQVQRTADLLNPQSDSVSLFQMIRGNDPTPSQFARANEAEEQLEKAILALDEPYRTAVEMRFIHQMSNDEIAASGALRSARDGTPLATREQVKLIVHRARARLKPLLGEE